MPAMPTTQNSTSDKYFDWTAMRRLSHTAADTALARREADPGREAAGESVGSAIDRVARALKSARVHFGHGTDNARDEAAELVFFVAGLDHALGSSAYSRRLSARRSARIDALLARRIAERVPLPYLTHRSFFAGLELYVDERRVRRILDVGTGSGAIALACAMAFPKGRVDAVDVSAAAAQVARRNVRRLNLEKRVRVLRSNYFDAVKGRRYDIIVSNPPYVGRAEMRRLPREYEHEPRIGLASGADGLDSVRAIFAGARRHLSRDGILVVEVGNTEATLLRTFPRLPFVWPEIAMGGGGVFLLRARDLDAE